MDDPTPGQDAPDRLPMVEHADPRQTPTEAQAEPRNAPPDEAAEPRPGRPLVERIGMAAIALLMAGLFGVVAIAAVAGGEIFLAAMGALGCLMTIWVGAMTLLRG